MRALDSVPSISRDHQCESCTIRDIVLFADLIPSDISSIHAKIDDFIYSTGDLLFERGGIANFLFTIHAGMVKLVRRGNDGRDRIVRVLRKGDLLGIEALGSTEYSNDAIALTQLQVCKIPLNVIQDLNRRSPRLHARLMQKWQQALQDAEDWIADLNFGTAKKRVANLLLKMRHPDEPNITTVFSRADMGAMLDLKFETVSREVSGFVQVGAIAQKDSMGRVYEILDEARLHSA